MKHLLCLLALAPPLWGQTIKLPAEVKIAEPGLIVVRATELDADDVRWWSKGGLQTFPPDIIAPKPGVFMGFALKPGTYKIGVVAAKAVGGKAVIGQPQECTVIVGGTPPGPDPGPGPNPMPPVPIKGLRVLLVRETGGPMTKEQTAIFGSTKIVAYLNEKCIKDDGRAGWRKWDKDQNTDNESQLWKDLWGSVKPKLGALPAIVIVDGQSGTVYPMPETEQAVLDFLKAKAGG